MLLPLLISDKTINRNQKAEKWQRFDYEIFQMPFRLFHSEPIVVEDLAKHSFFRNFADENKHGSIRKEPSNPMQFENVRRAR